MLPQATGITVGRILGLDVYSQAMLGRLFNLLFFCMAGYFAIKFIPENKIFLLIFLLSPKIIYISSTLSGDVFTNAVCILLITYILKLRNNKERFKLKNFILLLLLMPCVAISKVVYLPLCFLVLLIPKECFKSIKEKLIICLILLLIAITIFIFWTSIANVYNLNIKNSNTAEQLNFIFSNPIKYIGILGYNIFNYFSTWSLDMVGGYMQWGTILTQPDFISICIYLLLAVSLLNERKENKISLNKSCYITIIILLAVIFAGILTSMYIACSSVNCIGGLEIYGVQGRYFVPIVLLIIAMIPRQNINEKLSLKNYVLYVGLLLCQIPSLLNIITANI